MGLTVGDVLLGGDGGGPRSGAVGGAQRSGPPFMIDAFARSDDTEGRVY